MRSSWRGGWPTSKRGEGEEEALARRALEKLEGPGVVVMPFTGLELLNNVVESGEEL